MRYTNGNMLTSLSTGWLPVPATVATASAAEAKARLFIQRGRRKKKRLSLPVFSPAEDASWEVASRAVSLLSNASCVSPTDRSCSCTYLEHGTSAIHITGPSEDTKACNSTTTGHDDIPTDMRLSRMSLLEGDFSQPRFHCSCRFASHRAAAREKEMLAQRHSCSAAEACFDQVYDLTPSALATKLSLRVLMLQQRKLALDISRCSRHSNARQRRGGFC